MENNYRKALIAGAHKTLEEANLTTHINIDPFVESIVDYCVQTLYWQIEAGIVMLEHDIGVTPRTQNMREVLDTIGKFRQEKPTLEQLEEENEKLKERIKDLEEDLALRDMRPKRGPIPNWWAC